MSYQLLNILMKQVKEIVLSKPLASLDIYCFWNKLHKSTFVSTLRTNLKIEYYKKSIQLYPTEL